MWSNLGQPLDEFRQSWEEDCKSHKGECPYHDSRFEQGWTPLACVPYSPALGRFKGDNELAEKIVRALNTEGEFMFKDRKYIPVDIIEPALKDIMFHVPSDIFYLIADHKANLLMLDRKAFTTDGDEISCYIQWYLQRAEKKE